MGRFAVLVVLLPCRLLVPAAALAAMTNLRVFRVGTRVFGAAVPELEEGETGSMSKKYMMASVVVLLIFQSLAAVVRSGSTMKASWGKDLSFLKLPDVSKQGIGLLGLPP